MFVCLFVCLLPCTAKTVYSTEVKLGVVNAIQWYGIFSVIILPINSVINPLLYDKVITTYTYRITRRPRKFIASNFRRSFQFIADITVIQTMRNLATNVLNQLCVSVKWKRERETNEHDSQANLSEYLPTECSWLSNLQKSDGGNIDNTTREENTNPYHVTTQLVTHTEKENSLQDQVSERQFKQERKK